MSISSASVIDLALAVIVIEALVLLLARRMFPRLAFRDLWPTLASGVCLLMVARAATHDDELQALVWLSAAGLAHVADLVARAR